MKDDAIAALVNGLVQCAQTYSATQQLRGRLGEILVASLQREEAELVRLRSEVSDLTGLKSAVYLLLSNNITKSEFEEVVKVLGVLC